MTALLLLSLWVFIGLAFVALLAIAGQGYCEDERPATQCGIYGDGAGGE